jgi:hypothetical protein
VTSDPFALELARQYDFEVIPDAANLGETAAIEMATSVCVSRGVDSTLILPADIPLIQAGELRQIIEHAPVEGSVLASAGLPIFFLCDSGMTVLSLTLPPRRQPANRARFCDFPASRSMSTIPRT